jgi:hypothetical protein
MDEGVVPYSMEERRELLVEAMAKVQYPVLPSVAFDAKPAELVCAAKGLNTIITHEVSCCGYWGSV